MLSQISVRDQSEPDEQVILAAAEGELAVSHVWSLVLVRHGHSLDGQVDRRSDLLVLIEDVGVQKFEYLPEEWLLLFKLLRLPLGCRCHLRCRGEWHRLCCSMCCHLRCRSGSLGGA